MAHPSRLDFESFFEICGGDGEKIIGSVEPCGGVHKRAGIFQYFVAELFQAFAGAVVSRLKKHMFKHVREAGLSGHFMARADEIDDVARDGTASRQVHMEDAQAVFHELKLAQSFDSPDVCETRRGVLSGFSATHGCSG